MMHHDDTPLLIVRLKSYFILFWLKSSQEFTIRPSVRSMLVMLLVLLTVRLNFGCSLLGSELGLLTARLDFG